MTEQARDVTVRVSRGWHLLHVTEDGYRAFHLNSLLEELDAQVDAEKDQALQESDASGVSEDPTEEPEDGER